MAEASTSAHDSCLICGGKAVLRFSARGYPIFECSACIHRYAGHELDAAHIARTYDDSYFTDGGAGYSDYLADHSALVEQGRFYGRLLSRYCAPGTILDVGAAAGFLMEGLRACGWKPLGIEPNQTMAQHARSQLGLPVEIGTLENYDPGQRFDVVALIQVLGHFIDPRRALEKVGALTEPGGLVLTETWNYQSMWARVCGTHWHEYSPPSVLNFFSRASLVRLMRDCGFERVAWGARHKKIRAGHARTLATHVYGASAVMTKALATLPEQLSIPYLPDDLFWAIWRPVSTALH